MSGNWPLHADLTTPTFTNEMSHTLRHQSFDELNVVNTNKRANLVQIKVFKWSLT